LLLDLPNLTFQFSIPFPNPIGGTYPSPAWGNLNPAPNPNPETFDIKLAAI